MTHDPWLLDKDLTFLNHGSFGATPRPVLEAQLEWRRRMEADPVAFLGRDLERHLDEAREVLASHLGADPAGLVFLPNATTGVNTILRSLELRPGDEILTTDHEYNATLNAIEELARRSGASAVVANVPFPIQRPDDAVEAILDKVTGRTRFAVISHVTSPTALVLPVARIVQELAARGIDALVDGAHAPGMIPLDLTAIDAAYYTGNCHKWLCSPKGAGFLYVREDRRARIRPLAISHGRNSTRVDRDRFRLEFDWMGTVDPTAFLTVPVALRFIGSLLPGGWPALMEANSAMAREARTLLCDALGSETPSPDDMLGSMAAIIIPRGHPSLDGRSSPALGERLFERHRIQVPVFDWPGMAARASIDRPDVAILRVSAQVYNRADDYRRLRDALTA